MLRKVLGADIKRKCATLLLMFIIVGCSPGTVQKGKFSSLLMCLARVSEQAGEKLRPTIDDPGYVSGITRDGKTWWCKECETGTQGTYWEGAVFD